MYCKPYSQLRDYLLSIQSSYDSNAGHTIHAAQGLLHTMVGLNVQWVSSGAGQQRLLFLWRYQDDAGEWEGFRATWAC